jgi:hypothetical protein
LRESGLELRHDLTGLLPQPRRRRSASALAASRRTSGDRLDARDAEPRALPLGLP